ncbi:hypothetical protein LEP1GSC195_3896 [Leptospira wolbachii serovar Codice str. CDC]|uniref:Uncharacterized protein n=1 Tax=Leptospira wolbachii serovar Codice str. CDC TaxID=1218599 RepID=R9A3F8_9LEPT|nr:hypothetical protein LEP1GSC195_3896 [Leptospira wolbachii serovar Codice str. CDC]
MTSVSFLVSLQFIVKKRTNARDNVCLNILKKYEILFACKDYF